MARVNITIPDELLHGARHAGLNVSQVAARALVDELDRLAKIEEIDAYLGGLEADLGPVSPEEREAAAQWADQFAPRPSDGSSQARPA